MKKIAIVGAGGLGREIYCMIQAINRVEPTWEFIGFFDDSKPMGSYNEYGEFLGNVDMINEFNEPLDIVIAIANGSTIEKIVNKIKNVNISFPNLIYPDISFADINNLSIGIGNIIGGKSTISCNCKINNFNIFNGRTSMGHDTTIGSYNTIMPSVSISGEVTIGDYNFVGVNAVILQQIVIGDNVRIGAGSVIIRKTQNNMLYVGNPAVKMNF